MSVFYLKLLWPRQFAAVCVKLEIQGPVRCFAQNSHFREDQEGISVCSRGSHHKDVCYLKSHLRFWLLAERIAEIGIYQQKQKLVNQPDVRNGLSTVKLKLFKIWGIAKISRDTHTHHERLLLSGGAGSQYHQKWIWALISKSSHVQSLGQVTGTAWYQM